MEFWLLPRGSDRGPRVYVSQLPACVGVAARLFLAAVPVATISLGEDANEIPVETYRQQWQMVEG